MRTEILIAPEGEEVLYPAVTKADILLALSQEGADRWTGAVKEDGCILYDISNVTEVPPFWCKDLQSPPNRNDKRKVGNGVGSQYGGIGDDV